MKLRPAYYSNINKTIASVFIITFLTMFSSAKVIAQACVQLSTAASSDQNYIITSTPRRSGITAGSQLIGLPTCELMQTVQYFDGLGRPLQTVQVKGNPDASRDLVQPVAYDAFGREAIKYLPYTTASNTGTYKSTAVNAAAGVAAFYLPAGSSGSQQSNGVVRTSRPFAVTVFEPSPLNRVTEQGATGFNWQPEQGHSRTMTYSTNGQDGFSRAVVTNNPGGNRVALYTAIINSDQSRTLSRTGNTANYATGQLYRTIITNENRTASSGCLGSTEEYKDKEDRVVVKRTYNKLVIPGATTILQQLSTYYVYDDLGNLSYVLPPGANPDTAAAISPVTLNSLCYQYRYDERNRMTGKKLPGKAWEYMVYNKLDQLVARQDSGLRQNSQWEVTKHDALGRVIMVGTWTRSTAGFTAAVFRDSVYANPQWDVKNNTGAGTGYTITSYPSTLTTTMKINFYDDYNNIPSWSTLYDYPGRSMSAKGLLTVSKTAVLNSPTTRLWKIYYYDDNGRNTRTISQHYLGGTGSTYNYDEINSVYNFNNQVVKTTRKQYVKNSGGTAATLALTVMDSLTYDHMGRNRRHLNQLTSGTSVPQAMVIASQKDYNEIGQLLRKNLHSTDNGSSYRQAVDYQYNPRGWMVKNSAPLFAQDLQYQDGSVPQYNGNIASQSWGPAGSTAKTANYTYDWLDRLTSGIHSDGYSEKGISYDRMGNILTLSRYRPGVRIDSLVYHYPNGGLSNQPDTIRDLSGSTEGAKPSVMAYTYSGNGYIKKDGRNNSTITYNYINLPQTVTTTGYTITYTYDADGRKLRKVSVNGALTTATDYIDGIQYASNGGTAPVVDFVQTAEGRAMNSGGSYNYEYFLTDHLGNTRVSFDVQGTTANAKQYDDYYPFGMDINSIATSPKNNYLYNNKELQDETGQYDYGARFYDPVIGRFTTVDPMAEVSRRWSTYAYSYNNPVRFVDKDGMIPGDFLDEKGRKVGSDGKDDGKVYVIKTTDKNFDSGAPSAGISKDDKKATEKFIKDNNGNTTAFESNDIAYKNSVEIEGKASTRQAMVDVANQDNGKGGTADANNREYGGVVKTDGTVSQSPAGPVSDPTVNPNAHIDIASFDFQSTFHSHPSGDKTVSSSGSSPFGGTTLGGTTTSGSFLHAPSNVGGDVGNSGSKVNYVFSRGNGTVYIYNNTGVIATIPQANFVTPKQ
jgi:RHS repeat-associated protein